MDAWKPHLLWSVRPRSFRGRSVACVGNRPRLPDVGQPEKSAKIQMIRPEFLLSDLDIFESPGLRRLVCLRQRARIEWRLRVVFDEQLTGLRGLSIHK